MFESVSGREPSAWPRVLGSALLTAGAATIGGMISAAVKNSLAIPYVLFTCALVAAFVGARWVNGLLPHASAPVLLHIWNALLFFVPATACFLLFAVGCGFGDRNCKGSLALGAFVFIPVAALVGFAATVWLARRRDAA